MAKRIRSWNKSKYEQYIKMGRGQGEGPAYLPWISIHDFSSRGIVSRIAGYKTKRIHHFLSRNELNYFFLLEWSDKVLDIREQFPLIDMELATDIARQIGVGYPRDNITGFPYTLTCDFMVTTKEGLRARTVKRASDLNDKRTLEKLEIERRYWQCIGIDWKIVTEKEIPEQKCLNIEWLYTAAEIPEYLASYQLRTELLSELYADIPVYVATKRFEMRNGFPAGSGIRLLKNMLWHKEIACDMSIPLATMLLGNGKAENTWLK